MRLAVSQTARPPMEHIVPRWEWRAFGQDFGAAEQRFADLTPDRVQSSEEIYLVAPGSDANVKIRDQLLDIKQLEHVNVDGLEQWRPVLKEPFPLTASTVAQVRDSLGLSTRPPTGESLSQDELLTALAPKGGPVRAVKVSKTRSRYRAHGCLAELTNVIADGTSVRTVAIEDSDPAKVIAAVRAMGLDRYTNTSYPRGLRQILGLSN
jgi:exopolyphosphatase / guanosine-5'-triphosphate,3'-diphosphate pyrophosphatase